MDFISELIWQIIALIIVIEILQIPQSIIVSVNALHLLIISVSSILEEKNYQHFSQK